MTTTHVLPDVKPGFFVAPDGFGTPTVWTGDPERPIAVLGRYTLGPTAEADALWVLIERAVGGDR